MGLRGVIGVPVRKSMFLFCLKFYLKPNIQRVLAVWAEITGAVGTARIRAELIPDPPL